MENLDLKQRSLLELSGELTPAARKDLFDEISNSPASCQEYEQVRDDFALLCMLPIPEPSAEERRSIPAQIKRSIRAGAVRPTKRAGMGRLLVQCAASLLIAGIVGIAAGMSWTSSEAASRHSAEQIAKINAATERLPSAAHRPGSYQVAVNDVEASIRQLETESPTLSSVYDKNLANLLDALASVPQVQPGDWAGEDALFP